VALEGEGFAAGAGVPDLRRVVLGGGGEAAAVGTEGHAADLPLVALEGEGFAAGAGVPDLGRAVPGGGGEAAAVGLKATPETGL
jgi:hypothetical protein